MTFIPSVLSKLDNNNSTTTVASNFTGTSTETTGYTNLIITIKSDIDSSAGGIIISFSSDNITFTSYYTDTYFTNTTYNRTFKIINKYYKISYTSPSTPSSLSITSFLDTNSSDTTVQVGNDVYSTANDSTRDAFGKLRTTFPTTLLDNKFPSSAGTTEYKSNNMIDCYKSTGSTSFTYGNSKVILTATGSGSATSQSRKYCVYQPGKSILILLSGVINASSNTADCITRLGYFDDNNGLFFQYTNNTMSVVLRNTGVEDIKINQTSWNIDKMDGTGVSSISLDFTKSQLYVIDFEWLSVGRIRFGFYLFGKINYCHQITNLNSLTAPYMLSPNLPSRYQILSTSGATGTLTQICTTVISEGGYTPIGRAFSAGTNPNTSVSVPTTETPIIAITGISTYNHENILPISFTIMDTDNNNGYLYRLRLYLSPTGASSPLNGATVVNVNDNSVVAYSISGLTIPAGSIIVDQGYFYGRGIVSFNSLSDVFTNIIQITSNIDNVSDVLLLTAEKTGTTGAGNVFASISWQEIY
jgi:hypothetical protein